MTVFQIGFLIYSVIAVAVFLGLVVARQADKVVFEYTTAEAHALKSLLGELGLFALIGLLWPLFLAGIKISWGKKGE